MRTGTSIRTIAAATVLSIGLLVGIGQAAPSTAFAAPTSPTVSSQQQCEAAGYMWSSSKKQCANKKCGGAQPGTVNILTSKSGGGAIYFMCDGFTGKWVHYA
ncbi:MAG: hypothetical protein ACKVVP_15215 [Chloroflexota bacterium]